jgi:hypothetical protein
MPNKGSALRIRRVTVIEFPIESSTVSLPPENEDRSQRRAVLFSSIILQFADIRTRNQR